MKNPIFACFYKELKTEYDLSVHSFRGKKCRVCVTRQCYQCLVCLQVSSGIVVHTLPQVVKEHHLHPQHLLIVCLFPI